LKINTYIYNLEILDYTLLTLEEEEVVTMMVKIILTMVN